ncbi:hypothetical protein PVL29_022775 [Vitis rotundifolia]|uniref:Uncharacterized protein n=1 Tax=Vitis rotundifolia TaxID=103349 RepID=A0AA38YWI1_VITRO|nr:hypothetical protein PVL29_022775 [Vitis rotundifolia]
MEPFVSKRMTTNLSGVEAAQALSELCFEFPDLYIGCYRKSKLAPLIISFEEKDIEWRELYYKILYDANHNIIGIGTNDMGIAKNGSK